MTTLHGCVRHGFMANLRYEWICEVSSSSLKMTMYPLTHQKKNIWILRKPDSIFCVIMSVMEGLGFIDRSVNSQGHPPQTGQAADCAPRKENTCPRKFRNGFESLQGNDCYHSQWICLRENSQERRVVPSTIKNVEVSSKLSLKLKTNPMTFN